VGRHDIVNCFSVEIVEGVTAHPLTVIERNSVGADQWKLSVGTHHPWKKHATYNRARSFLL
jgi:hypothetical protein